MYTQDTHTKYYTLQPSTHLQKDSPQVPLHKTKPIEITQTKQVQQTTEPVLPHIKWNTDSIELNGKTHKLPITKDTFQKNTMSSKE